MDISIIIINYQSQELLKKCIKSINENLEELKAEIIIVNNDSKKIVLDKEPNRKTLSIEIIESGTNLGFAKACNSGAKKARGKFILFLNPDAFLTNNSLLEAINYLEKNPDTGALGGKIIENKTGAPQPWTSGKKTSLNKILFKNTIAKPWKKNRVTKVDWVSGTALLTPKETFFQIGGFDENFFMYFEDQDYCLRVKNIGKKVVFHPEFQITHYNGKSWSDKKKQKKQYFRSQQIFFKKHMPFQAKALNILHKLLMP
ncbi:MAG: glycosyltransferase family 2 protein [Candidatus Moraniibacteriota bacterium]